MLDFSERIKKAAHLSIRHTGNMLDKNKNNIPYFFVKLAPAGSEEDSYAWHSEWDFGDAVGRYLDSLISSKWITGSKDGLETEEKLKNTLRWMSSKEDGLSYRLEDNDWVKTGANMFDQRSVLLGLISWYLDTHENEPYEYIKGMVRSLAKIGAERDNYICFPFINYNPGMEIPEELFDDGGFIVDACHYGGGVTILPLAVFYELTGDKDTFYLMEKLVNFIVYHSMVFDFDTGSFWSKFRDDCDGHFHARMGTAAGIARYAQLVSNKELLEWCDRVYRWAKSFGSSTGWFPEYIGQDPDNKKMGDEFYTGAINHSETCCTTDMIHCAIQLSRNNFRDYLDEAEMYLNQLFESQIVDVSHFKKSTGKEDTDSHSYFDIPNRYKGAFTGRSRVNDLSLDGEISTMACCCAAGLRGLHLVWDSCVQKSDGKIYVNYLFSKETPEIKIKSMTPDEGHVEINALVNSELYVRIPSWIVRSSIVMTRNGMQVNNVHIENNYIYPGYLNAGDKIIISFQIKTSESNEIIAGNRYILTYKGSKVVNINPKGLHMPFYYND